MPRTASPGQQTPSSGRPFRRLFPRSFRMQLLRAALRLGMYCASPLSWRAAYRLADRLGDLGFLLLIGYRRRALGNLQQAFGGVCPDRELQRMARRSFRHLARGLVELLKQGELTPQQWRELVRVEGEQHLQRALGHPEGCIAIGAHLGNWEWSAARLSLDYPMSFATRSQRDPKLDVWLAEVRGETGGQAVPQGDPRALLRALRRGGALGILADRNERYQPVFAPFFGRLAATHPGPVLLAQRRGLPLLSIFTYRTQDRHRVVIFPPLQLDAGGDPEHDLLRNVRRMNCVIETAIESCPDQWIWIHPRWRTRPKADS